LDLVLFEKREGSEFFLVDDIGEVAVGGADCVIKHIERERIV